MNGIPKIIDFIDVDSDKWRQYAEHSRFLKKVIYRTEAARLRKYERKIADLVNHCIVTTNTEAELFRSFIPDMRISIVANGVDTEYFKSQEGIMDYGLSTIDKNKIIFTGQMDYFANVDGILYFYREIFPLIKKQAADVKLYIVGNNPVKEIVRLRGKDVIVTGFVKDIRPFLEESAVCVVPLRIARGVQNKILEAMAMGIPVVATSVAMKGIKAQKQKDILIGDTPDAFAQKVTALLKDKELRKSLAENGREIIKTEYNWNQNLSGINGILKEVCRGEKIPEYALQ